MATFPELSRSPGARGFSEELSDEAVAIGTKASGLPVVNKLFTFDPKTWKYTLYSVSQADKESIITFYNTYKDVPFDWTNAQNEETYEVIFGAKPDCQLDGLKTIWRIQLILIQYSPL